MQRVAVLVVMVALATTLLLPDRQTPQVINAGTGLLRGVLSTAMGTGAKV